MTSQTGRDATEARRAWQERVDARPRNKTIYQANKRNATIYESAEAARADGRSEVKTLAGWIPLAGWPNRNLIGGAEGATASALEYGTWEYADGVIRGEWSTSCAPDGHLYRGVFPLR